MILIAAHRIRAERVPVCVALTYGDYTGPEKTTILDDLLERFEDGRIDKASKTFCCPRRLHHAVH